ncbi:6-carboxytetrahydropterin synthase QueD [bacterium]|nr:6-carboxytetrahydropterin synthase QueD [bacterium]
MELQKFWKYTVYKEVEFAASHFLREYHGKCEHLHGHNYVVRVYVSANELDGEGIVYDFVKLKQVMNDVFYERFDHKHLNDIPPFDEINPSAENIATWIGEQMGGMLDDGRVRVTEVRVWETARNGAIYRR